MKSLSNPYLGPVGDEADLGWSRLGLGTGTLASLGRAVSVREAELLIETMLEAGIRVIDTADTYGSGDCELLLGRVTKGQSEAVAFITKAGYRLSNLPGPLRPFNQFVKKGLKALGRTQCFERAYLHTCLDNSLKRLRRDRVEGFLLHSPPLSVVNDDEMKRLFDEIRESGKATLTGVCSGSPAVVKAAVSMEGCGIIQTPASLKAAPAMRLLWRECADRGIRVVGHYVFDPACFEAAEMTHETLMRGSAALLPKSAIILCGTRNPAHLRQANEWAQAPLPEDQAMRLTERFAVPD